MPELPEVEITRQKLLPLIRGRKILDFGTDWPRGLQATNGKGQMTNGRWVATDIRGRRILAVRRRGKVLFFKLSGTPERVMAIHLRMSGSLEVVKETKGTEEPKGTKARWVHFVWRLGGRRELRFIDPRKFGRVWYGSPGVLRRDPYIASLGTDAKAILPDEFMTALRGRRGMVKPLLLRQDVVAGIGNILADESLWRARIHPRTSVAALKGDALGRLYRGLQATIRAVLSSGGTSMRTFRHPDGARGRYQERRLVYGRAGSPCPRCRTRLQRVVVGGRGTTICPQCQRMRI